MRSVQSPNLSCSAENRASFLLPTRRLCFVVQLLVVVHLPSPVHAVAPEYRGSAEAGTPEGAIIAACACIGCVILLAVGIAYYRYRLRRQWQRMVDATAQELREESAAVHEDEETPREKDLHLDNNDDKVHFKAYFQHSSIQDKPNTTIGHLLFHNHDHDPSSSTTTTNNSIGVESQQNKKRTTLMIGGSGGDSLGRFTIVQGELISSTGKCYWLQDFETTTTTGGSLSFTHSLFCSPKRQQVLVTGCFDVSNNNDNNGTTGDGQKAVVFRDGKWQANDGASGHISSLQFSPPLYCCASTSSVA